MKTTTRHTDINDDNAFDACLSLARKAERNRDLAGAGRAGALSFSVSCRRRMTEAKGKKAKAAVAVDQRFADAAYAREERRLRRYAFVAAKRTALCQAWGARRTAFRLAWEASFVA